MAGNGEGTYVCTLDEKTLKKAKAELNEDPKQRASQIETFRQWVKAQPHISSRTGLYTDSGVQTKVESSTSYEICSFALHAKVLSTE